MVGMLDQKEKRLPLEKPIKLQDAGSGKILNIAAHDPQTWDTVIDVWKGLVVADYIRNISTDSPEEMYKYLETYLRESTKAYCLVQI